MDETKHIYTPAPSEPVSQTVVTAMAEAKGVDPMDLTERLYDCIDPDALDRLFATCDRDSIGAVVFEMAGCRVKVESCRAVVVTRTEEQSRSEAYA